MKFPEACTSELRGVKDVRVVGVLSHSDICVASISSSKTKWEIDNNNNNNNMFLFKEDYI